MARIHLDSGDKFVSTHAIPVLLERTGLYSRWQKQNLRQHAKMNSRKQPRKQDQVQQALAQKLELREKQLFCTVRLPFVSLSFPVLVAMGSLSAWHYLHELLTGSLRLRQHCSTLYSSRRQERAGA